jgi:hypothetical protein
MQQRVLTSFNNYQFINVLVTVGIRIWLVFIDKSSMNGIF